MVNLRAKRAADIAAEDMHYKVLIYGPNGVGKTWTSASAPAPLVVLSERNGLQSIRHANPDALVVELYDVTDDDGEKVPPMIVLREILRAAIRGQLDEVFGAQIRTVVLDSGTDIQRLFMDEISAGGAMTQAQWGELATKFRLFMRTLRNIPYHVVMVALEDTVVEESSGTRFVGPAFKGSTRHQIGQWFNLVAYLIRRERRDDESKEVVVRKCMLEGPQRFVCKPQHPLGGYVDPDIPAWFQALAGEAKADTKSKKAPAMGRKRNNKAGAKPAEE